MDEYFTEYPPVVKHPYTSVHHDQVKPIDWQAADDSLQVDRTVGEVSWATPGKFHLILLNTQKQELIVIKFFSLFFSLNIHRLYWWNSAIRIIHKRTCYAFCTWT